VKEMAVAALKAKTKVCMFDQYGTVVDMQKGLTEVVTPYLREKGWGGRTDAFVSWWRRTHFENSMQKKRGQQKKSRRKGEQKKRGQATFLL
jgi:hypothetical protein